MNNRNSSIKLIKFLLPKVSRTFALNIRVLNKKDYLLIAIAYLICRYLDTIEDSEILTNREKIRLFNKIEVFFKTNNFSDQNKWLVFFENLSKKKHIKEISHNHYENILWQKFSWIIREFFTFEKKYQLIFLPPILKMLQGMCYFIKKKINRKNKIISDEKEMEKYCYYVAGTVSELLNNFFKQKIKSPKRIKVLEKNKYHFGLGLQMINILKDLFNDKKRGWIYIPKKNILKKNLTIHEFFTFNFKKKSKILSVYRNLIKKADKNLEKAMIYTINIPKNLVRYRIFCLIPLFLAIKTSLLLKKQDNFRNFRKKISKFNTIFTFFTCFLLAFSNSLIKKYFYSIK